MKTDFQASPLHVNTRRRLLAAGVALAAAFACVAGSAQAQGTYPTKPFTMIICAARSMQPQPLSLVMG